MNWKKLLIIAIAVAGFGFASAPNSNAGVRVGIGIGVPVGYGYGYGNGYSGYGYGYGGAYGRPIYSSYGYDPYYRSSRRYHRPVRYVRRHYHQRHGRRYVCTARHGRYR